MGCEGTGSRTTINVAGHRTIEEADCALCGQCITHCPVGALRVRDDTEDIWDAIADPDKIVVAQVAPAVRTAWGEEFGLSDEEATVGKILDALKRMGVDYAFDTTFSADLTIMEEGTEFLHRFTAGELKERPMFTSCCPGWLRFIKYAVPTSGETAFNGEITAADVRSCDEDLLCREARSISAEDLHSISHAMCGKKRRKGDGTVLSRICGI